MGFEVRGFKEDWGREGARNAHAGTGCTRIVLRWQTEQVGELERVDTAVRLLLG